MLCNCVIRVELFGFKWFYSPFGFGSVLGSHTAPIFLQYPPFRICRVPKLAEWQRYKFLPLNSLTETKGYQKHLKELADNINKSENFYDDNLQSLLT